MDNEIWKDIIGYESYKISNLGRVKNKKERILRQIDTDRGYKTLSIYNKNGKKVARVHQLVAKAFVPNPENKPHINHKNGIKADNRSENLEWCTISENVQHRFKVLGHKGSWLGKKGKENPNSEPVIQFTLEGEFIKKWDSMRQIERELNLHHSGIGFVCRGKRKNCGGFIWKYEKDKINWFCKCGHGEHSYFISCPSCGKNNHLDGKGNLIK